MNSLKPELSNIPKLWLGSGSEFYGARIFNSGRPIVIFDSGIGGLTVVRELEQLIQDADILYVADNEWFPYGSKAGPDIARRVEQLLDRLRVQINPAAIVVACNTASVAIIDHGTEDFRRHCFLVTPLLNEAVNASENNNIVFLATPGTLKSRYVIQAITSIKMSANIWPIATQSLVALSEARLAGEESNFEDFAELIGFNLTEEQRLSIDTVVLGCTHFPHLIDGLRRIFPSAHNWIDPARKVALQVVASRKVVAEPISEQSKVVTFTSKREAVKYCQVFSRSGFGLLPSPSKE